MKKRKKKEKKEEKKKKTANKSYSSARTHTILICLMGSPRTIRYEMKIMNIRFMFRTYIKNSMRPVEEAPSMQTTSRFITITHILVWHNKMRSGNKTNRPMRRENENGLPLSTHIMIQKVCELFGIHI